MSLNLQDPSNKNLVNCDDKLKRILLGKPQVALAELPMLIKLHFPKELKRWAGLISQMGTSSMVPIISHLFRLVSVSFIAKNIICIKSTERSLDIEWKAATHFYSCHFLQNCEASDLWMHLMRYQHELSS